MPPHCEQVAASVDFLGFLFGSATAPDMEEFARGDILVVDDEPISRRAIAHALEKGQLKCTCTEDPNAALKLLEDRPATNHREAPKLHASRNKRFKRIHDTTLVNLH